MSDRPDHFMPLYIGDYLGDTVHLTAMEHGAYMLLLMAYWRAGKPLDNDDAQLARICRCTPKEWQKVKPVVLAFFEVGAQLVHGRVEKELKRAAEQYAARVERSKAAAAKRWAKQCSEHATSMPQAYRKQSSSNAQAMLEECQPQPQPQPYSLGKPSERARARNCWPPDAVVPENWIRLAAEQRRLAGLPPINLQVSAQMFANFYAADTANPRTMAEYQAKWNNWALKEKTDDGSTRSKRSTTGDTLRELARMAAENEGNAEPDSLGV